MSLQPILTAETSRHIQKASLFSQLFPAKNPTRYLRVGFLYSMNSIHISTHAIFHGKHTDTGSRTVVISAMYRISVPKPT